MTGVIKTVLLVIDIQHTLERYKLCGHKLLPKTYLVQYRPTNNKESSKKKKAHFLGKLKKLPLLK